MFYVGDDLIKLRNMTPMRKQDRHIEKKDRHTEKKDRHTEKKDRHCATEERNQDRHTEKKDRHCATEERNQNRHTEKKDRHVDKAYQQKYYKNKLKKDILNDTGMDLICSSCVEWKSVGSCKSVDKIPNEKIVKYLIESDLK